MSAKKGKLKNLIRDYLLDEGILREKISNPNFEFGFIFSFPPGPKYQMMSVFKPKNKNFIHIAMRIQLSENHAKELKALKDNKGLQFFTDIRKYFINKEVYFKIDINNFIYEIIEQIFLNKEGEISRNYFFKGIQKVFYCFLFSNLLLMEYCSGKEISTAKFGAEFDFSLYS
ncbi:MAG: DUF2299 family protein [Promethearchaeota archaeon]